MYGEMLVPTMATRVNKYAPSKLKRGLTISTATVPHSGRARKADATYPRNTRVINKNTRSTRLYDPLTTNHQIVIAAIGTEMKRGIPNSSVAAAIPTNSET